MSPRQIAALREAEAALAAILEAEEVTSEDLKIQVAQADVKLRAILVEDRAAR